MQLNQRLQKKRTALSGYTIKEEKLKISVESFYIKKPQEDKQVNSKIRTKEAIIRNKNHSIENRQKK